ncbi:Bis(5'nucleosyl)-tetraphosphatase, ApaH [Pasteurella testudinis DSM 23072]|uniref:Bis(5'-nucleosyl)-tetraphosphatase, symmetrical n=1 Tax=Pasteurella testudinis DSM 23072 TaxID=1122938 RepID=A0A1W1URK8_9PAST|nr:bis(5'-nucleosyl)-tetraphosphatase (symmetrical) ApaH [Pasteurella testudinis]SMB83742.1 Bis(5'nucleosyl)-tetraphosphatase, ApaH [Pasteurella testudinis DSM 23072]SUB50985.1 bis(5'-nucleosyl)-tetraphosphatase, symmetrical [Pasteurella testudinis]
MATYIVGDLQGCFDELQLLLDKVRFEPQQDELWLVGDLVARGDKSLECLRFIKGLGESAKTVLGNHDLHLIATALGLKSVKKKDRVDAIFAADDFAELIDWLRHQPLLRQHPKHGFIMCHAGISPDWTLRRAKKSAAEVEAVLQHGDYRTLIKEMYGEQPDRWSKQLKGIERLRYIINVFTRMRFCYADHRLDFACKTTLAEAPADLFPWYELDNATYQQQPILFGHWASLVGEPMPKGIYALDSGCVWGNYMTMLRWEDQQFFYQRAVKSYT